MSTFKPTHVAILNTTTRIPVQEIEQCFYTEAEIADPDCEFARFCIEHGGVVMEKDSNDEYRTTPVTIEPIVDVVPAGIHVRMLTTRGPRDVRPMVCATEEALGVTRERGMCNAHGTSWTWSVIQQIWVEVRS